MANSSLNLSNSFTNHQNTQKNEADDLIFKPLRPRDHLFLPIEQLDLPHKNIILTLPQEKRWIDCFIRKYQGFWQPEGLISGIISLQNSFKPRPNDIFLASSPKCGTTWLKAVTFAIINRNRYEYASHPLLRISPHDCVKFLDFLFLEGNQSYFESLPSPRVSSFHMAYSVLPDAMKASECKIVYICRDPKDALVSLWHMNKLDPIARDQISPFSLAFELFCDGRSLCGPIWEHMLEYWNESLQRPEKVLFIKYENLSNNPLGWVKRTADFLGYPFSEEEKIEGVPEKIVELCSFKSLTSLDVNKKKNGNADLLEMNHVFFRKGMIGDWRNHMSLEMAEKIDAITREKFEGSGLSFSSSTIDGDIDSS